MNILVTGAAGFIGSHSVDKLLKMGHHIVGIDNFDDYYEKKIKQNNIKSALNDPKFVFIDADITDKIKLNEIFLNNSFDCVLHLAAKAGVRPSIKNPESYINTNINGTLFILEAMKQSHVANIVFASSSSVYGNNPLMPFSETFDVDKPISPYAASKKTGELLCYTFHHLYNFNVFCLRFFTVYGPRQRPDLAIYKFTEKIMNNIPIEVFGDGSTSRDYTYIDDIVQGICLAIDKVNAFEIINLGESQAISIKKLIAVIEKKLNKKALIKSMPMQPGDVNTTFADISKAKKILGYNPIWSIEKGIEEFVKWKNNV